MILHARASGGARHRGARRSEAAPTWPCFALLGVLTVTTGLDQLSWRVTVGGSLPPAPPGHTQLRPLSGTSPMRAEVVVRPQPLPFGRVRVRQRTAPAARSTPSSPPSPLSPLSPLASRSVRSRRRSLRGGCSNQDDHHHLPHDEDAAPSRRRMKPCNNRGAHPGTPYPENGVHAVPVPGLGVSAPGAGARLDHRPATALSWRVGRGVAPSPHARRGAVRRRRGAP
eukprot:scaffold7560_cov390-Prasinococcus_capsulatus_cf.AAC.5